MCSKGYKTLSYGYKSISINELNALKEEYNEESDQFKNKLVQNMIYLCTFGFEDVIRENVKESLNLIRFGNKEA
jgi:magnesium-transporting ATPase (P-type)